MQPVGLQEAVRRAAPVVQRERRIELGRAAELRPDGGKILPFLPQRSGTACEADGAVEATLFLFLQHEVDDTGAGVGIEAC